MEAEKDCDMVNLYGALDVIWSENGGMSVYHITRPITRPDLDSCAKERSE